MLTVEWENQTQQIGRDRLLEILRRELQLTVSLRDSMKKDHRQRTRMYHDLVQESINLQHVIWLITDPQYADDIYNNLVKGGKNDG